MRSIAILAACAAFTVGTLPTIVHAQSTGQTSQTDVKTIWEKFKGSWTQTTGAVKEQWGKLTDDDLLEIEGRRDQLVGKIQPATASPKRPNPRSGRGSRSAIATCDRRLTMTEFRTLTATLVSGVAGDPVTASALAQAQFRDEKTARSGRRKTSARTTSFDPRTSQARRLTGVQSEGPDRHRAGRGRAAPRGQPDRHRAHHGRPKRAHCHGPRQSEPAGDPRRPLGGAIVPDKQQRRRCERADRLHLHQRQPAGAGKPHHCSDGGARPAAGVRRVRAADGRLCRPRALPRAHALIADIVSNSGNGPATGPFLLAESRLRSRPLSRGCGNERTWNWP